MTLRKPSQAVFDKYMNGRDRLLVIKEANDGMIGICVLQNRKGKDVYVSHLPQVLGSRTKRFDHPLKACIHYNMCVRNAFGEHAVLCDPLAVVRRFILNA